MLNIVLRTCSRKESQVHGTERIHPKEEILLKSFKSVINSINLAKDNLHKISLTIVDDNSDYKIQEILKSSCDKFIQLSDMNKTGNSSSLHTVYDYAKDNLCNNLNDLIYFLEDDYLHELTSIDEMLNFYYSAKTKLEGREVAICPIDCNDRYKPMYLRPSFIVPGDNRYWRTVDSTAGTHLISANLFLTNFGTFSMFANYGVNPYIHEENTINRMWRDGSGLDLTAVCFSPIPTLAYHLQIEEHLPLYTNYKILWDSINI